jgi:photosystem II stability/assembly factor-like uncharacterized protein
MSSCVKHEFVTFKVHSIPTSDEITSVYFRDEMNGIAVGGKLWKRGIVCRTHDGGKTWKSDSLFDKIINCIYYQDQLIFAMGIELKLYDIRTDQNNIINIYNPGPFKYIRSISVLDTNNIIAVHGFINGSIEKFGIDSDSTRTVLNLNRELYSIQCLDRLNCIVCGYGIILNTKDGGEHWDTLDVAGDQFIDIARVSSTIYILGIAGAIYKSDDSGQTYSKIRSGGIISNAPLFNSICFKNNNEGIIAGEAGLVMFTRDGGCNWSIADGLPSFDIKDIFFDDSRYWLCGSSGTIISFTL